MTTFDVVVLAICWRGAWLFWFLCAASLWHSSSCGSKWHLLSYGLRWRMNLSIPWVGARIGECCRYECASCGSYD